MTAMALINVRPTVYIDGEEDGDLRQALTSFVVNLPLSGMAHGEITANNWLAAGESGNLDYGFQSVGFGKTLEIVVGDNDPQTLFSGEITAVEERYGSGSPQLIILVQDKLQRLARSRNNRVFEDQSPDDIVNTIASELGLSADVNVSSASGTYCQMNESDLAFLTRLTGAYGIALRIDGDQLRVRAEEADPEPVELSAQDSALKVRLIADMNHQPTQVSAKGFNAATDEAVSQDADALANPPDGITAKEIVEQLSWAGENIVPQPFPRSQSEAEAFAKAHFARQAQRFISGDVQCMGEASLKSGREIELSGVSPRLAGKYRVVHCAHCFDNVIGFETHLKVNRADGNR